MEDLVLRITDVRRHVAASAFPEVLNITSCEKYITVKRIVPKDDPQYTQCTSSQVLSAKYVQICTHKHIMEGKSIQGKVGENGNGRRLCGTTNVHKTVLCKIAGPTKK